MPCDPQWLPAQPYADEDDLLCGECIGVDLDSAAWAWAVGAASRRVYEVTAGAFPGTMTSKIRPCRRLCTTHAQFVNDSAMLTRPRMPPALPCIIDNSPAPVLVNLWACECGLDPCMCTKRDAIVLPYRPVCEVTEVKIDGEVFTDWQLVGARLYRTDGKSWPTCNNIELPDTEPGTWSVTELWGTGLPPEGVPLVAEYACQLAKRACKKPCDLPDGIRVVSRAGVEYAVVDTKYRDGLLTGFTPLDDWLNVILGGPKRAREQPRLWTRGRAARRPRFVTESQVATPQAAVSGDGVLKETLHVRSNQALQKQVNYPGLTIEGGVLAIEDANGNEIISELADIVSGEAIFSIDAAQWPDPFPAEGSVGRWDMIVKIVGGDWDTVAAGPARFHDGVAEPVF